MKLSLRPTPNQAGISQLIWTHNKVLNKAQVCTIMGDQKIGGGTVYKHILINAKLQTRKRGQTAELTGRSQLMKRRSTLDCSAK
jgi:Fe2+ or Zn2+ uptake regulation protein